ncbi:acyl-CoA dehydrogenase family protein [Aequorivita capsosiphonis]|uniref:acyl-CoA dehydrogenase family protein n=1 Tax=Aequorivita capsosiphonis TaxID=487317 RepID=UPI0004210074|nr:acyl-CoA dehydrogenase family protein [Aequorivita capsosiphonis]
MFKAYNYDSLFRELSDHPRIFPKEAFQLLKNLGLFTLPHSHSGLFQTEGFQNIFDLLFEVGKSDLSVGRIFEGHLNALLLIDTFGTSNQKEKFHGEAADGKLFGIWNTERSFEKLNLKKSDSILHLKGAKIFCSGALNIDRPIVTATTATGLQMIILELERNSGLEEDWSLWNPTGMRASVSCRIDFTGLKVCEGNFLGIANDYYKEPHFSWGGVRFSAVQLGGAKAIVDITVAHLQKLKRTQDPYQKMRLGKLSILMETANLCLQRANAIDNSKEHSKNYKINFANMMRTLTVDICEETIRLAEKSIGIQGMMQSHPLEKKVRDLRVYLKQAGPDYALANIGDYTAKTKAKSCLKENV